MKYGPIYMHLPYMLIVGNQLETIYQNKQCMQILPIICDWHYYASSGWWQALSTNVHTYELCLTQIYTHMDSASHKYTHIWTLLHTNIHTYELCLTQIYTHMNSASHKYTHIWTLPHTYELCCTQIYAHTHHKYTHRAYARRTYCPLHHPK